MDAALAIETWIVAAQVPSTGAFISGADAAQGSASGGGTWEHLEHQQRHKHVVGFQPPDEVREEKGGAILRSRFGALTTAWNRKRARKMVALF